MSNTDEEGLELYRLEEDRSEVVTNRRKNGIGKEIFCMAEKRGIKG